MTLRQPTPKDVLYRWHREALKLQAMGDRRGIPAESPECGWYKCRLVKDGVFVPARIWVYQWTDESGELLDDEKIQCEINGQYADPVSSWSRLCGRPIPEDEYEYMMADRQWCLDFDPDHPKANPRQKIDLMKVRIPFAQ